MCLGGSSCVLSLRYVFSPVSVRCRSSGIILYIISNAAWGVERVVGVSDIHATRFSCLIFLCCFVDILCAHTSAPYVSLGLIIPVYTHLISFGLGPK